MDGMIAAIIALTLFGKITCGFCFLGQNPVLSCKKKHDNPSKNMKNPMNPH